MASDDLDIEAEEDELGISPLGMILVVMLALVGLALFLNPASPTYDVAIGGVIALSIALGLPPLQRWGNEGDLRRTFLAALIGTSVISILSMIMGLLTFSATTEGDAGIVQTTLILVLALPAVFEELLFRSGAYMNLRRVVGNRAAIVIQAVFFAIYHFARNPDPAYFLLLFAGGIVFMLIFLISRNILSSMLAHAIANLRPVIMGLLLSPPFMIVVVLALILVIWRRWSENG